MVAYSFTAMHQSSCDPSPAPPAPPHHLCLFACHIQAGWPFCCLSVHVSIPSLAPLTPYLLSSARGGGIRGESKAETPPPPPPGIVRCVFFLASSAEDGSSLSESISPLAPGVTHICWRSGGGIVTLNQSNLSKPALGNGCTGEPLQRWKQHFDTRLQWTHSNNRTIHKRL